MTFSEMGKTKSKKQSDKDTIAEITLEIAKPRVALSAREHSDPDGIRNSSSVTDISPLDPMNCFGAKWLRNWLLPRRRGREC
jgi:hypothetical protein